MTLSPKLGMVEISALCHFRFPLLAQMLIKAASFPQTIRNWNALPDSLISFNGVAGDCVGKFTSLVRAGD